MIGSTTHYDLPSILCLVDSDEIVELTCDLGGSIRSVNGSAASLETFLEHENLSVTDIGVNKYGQLTLRVVDFGKED